MLCWISKGELPWSTKAYNKLLKRYKDQTLLKIIEERDDIMVRDRIKAAQELEKKEKIKKATAANNEDNNEE